MISLADIFKGVGSDGYNVIDVQQALESQGVRAGARIPIYPPIEMQVLPANKVSYLCNSLQEATALTKLCKECGAVAITFDLGLEQLTFIGILAVFTPSTGMTVFVKETVTDLMNMSSDILLAATSANQLPVPQGALHNNLVQIATESIKMSMDMLMGMMQSEFEQFGINLYAWERIPDLIDELMNTQESQMMFVHRMRTGKLNNSFMNNRLNPYQY